MILQTQRKNKCNRNRDTHTRKSNDAGKNKSNHLLWKLDKWTWNQTIRGKNVLFLNCLVGILITIVFFNLNLNCFIVLDLRNLQEQVKKNFLFPKVFYLVISDFFSLTVGQNNFEKKTPMVCFFMLICSIIPTFLNLWWERWFFEKHKLKSFLFYLLKHVWRKITNNFPKIYFWSCIVCCHDIKCRAYGNEFGCLGCG